MKPLIIATITMTKNYQLLPVLRLLRIPGTALKDKEDDQDSIGINLAQFTVNFNSSKDISK